MYVYELVHSTKSVGTFISSGFLFIFQHIGVLDLFIYIPEDAFQPDSDFLVHREKAG